MHVWDFPVHRKGSYHWFFFDGPFLYEIKKVANFEFFEIFVFFDFLSKKYHRKKTNGTILSFSPKITKT